MTEHRPSSSSLLSRRLLAGAWALILLWAHPTSANEPTGSFRYELRALGALAGEAVLTVSPPRQLGDEAVRHVRLEARTSGVAGRVYSAMGDGTTIVDADYRALRMKWRSTLRGVPRDAELSFHDEGLKGTYRHRDRFALALDEVTKGRPLDAISAYLWLPQQALIAGHTYTRSFFDGRRVGTLTAEVGTPRSIQVPVGLREVVPMEIVVKTRAKPRRVTFWVGVKDRVLYRIEVSHRVLGRVRADLVAQRRGLSP